MLGRMTLAGVHSVEAALEFIGRYERECVREAQELERPPGSESGCGGISELVERLLIEERRRMIDAQLAWITYARAELRAMRAGPPR
jgi:hypothetical protein